MNQEMELQPRTAIEESAQKTLLATLGRYKKTIDALLPKMLDPKRFAYLAVSAIRQNPALAGVSPASFINCCILAGQMGLEIRRDSCYIVPFSREATLLIDYRGKMDLCRRSGKVGGIQAVAVREHDEFDWRYTIKGVEFLHRPSANGAKMKIPSAEDRGALVGFYGFAEIIGGGMQFREPMNLKEIDKVRKQSRAGVSSMALADIFAAQQLTEDGTKMIWQTWGYRDPRRQPWVTHFEDQALKTIIHRLCKGLPMTPELALSQSVDEGLETGAQPNILGDAVDIDPIDTQPMLPDGSEEERDRVLHRELNKIDPTGGLSGAEVQKQAQAASEKEQRRQSRVAKSQPPPTTITPEELAGVEPSAPARTPEHVAALLEMQKKIGDMAFFRILGGAGFENAHMVPLPKFKDLLREMNDELSFQQTESRA